MAIFAVIRTSAVSAESETDSSDTTTQSSFQIEGKIAPPDPKPKDWYWSTRIYLDGGKRMAFLKVIFAYELRTKKWFLKRSSITQEDNSFVISGLQSGSFLLEVSNPDFYYEPVRVDVNSKGKVRARKVNNVQPSQVNQLPYPLRLKSPGRFKYFQQREEWKISDMLMNPMIIMMVLPLLLITVLPKMMNDPETKREMEQMQQQMNVNNQVRFYFKEYFLKRTYFMNSTLYFSDA